jgi:hypothetical protein
MSVIAMNQRVPELKAPRSDSGWLTGWKPGVSDAAYRYPAASRAGAATALRTPQTGTGGRASSVAGAEGMPVCGLCEVLTFLP